VPVADWVDGVRLGVPSVMALPLSDMLDDGNVIALVTYEELSTATPPSARRVA
jgi:hypothetical protein